MLTTVVIVLLALALFGYVALPLINPRGADPLPVEVDPVKSDLEEEKDALFRAIRELDAREDLPRERREQLRARYEAKAAKVLRALDEHALAGKPMRARSASRRSRPPYGGLALLGISAVIATSLGAFVLPRVGQNASVTSFFQEDLDAARALRDLQRAAERDPSTANLLAVADAYWQLGDADGAVEAYEAVIRGGGQESALAYRRLAFLSLQEDLEEGLAYLERSRELEPTDLETLYTLGEIYFALGDVASAREAWEAFLAAPGGEDDEQVLARLELAGEVEPLLERVQRDPNRENLLALGNAYWRFDERQRAVEAYFQVLTQLDPNDPTALGRTGQLMFLSGRNDDAIALMERAASSDQVDSETLLFLGNAYFSAERYAEAIDVWERHVEAVGAGAAGRVPGLIEDARRRLAGADGSGADGSGADGAGVDRTSVGRTGVDRAGLDEVPAAGADITTDGAALFAANCAGCHGATGDGGAGPALRGNTRAGNEQNVRSAVSFGRGMMPGFSAVLTPEEIESVVEYVSGPLAAGGEPE